MTQAVVENIRQGWQVFAGPDRIGRVSYIGSDYVGVKTGRIVKHEYVIPFDMVSDAADGVVDLKVGRDVVGRMDIA